MKSDYDIEALEGRWGLSHITAGWFEETFGGPTKVQDVYKRQGYRRRPFSSSTHPTFSPVFRPVSYTHLDVYKRQA